MNVSLGGLETQCKYGFIIARAVEAVLETLICLKFDLFAVKNKPTMR